MRLDLSAVRQARSGLRAHQAGGALVIHPKGEADARALAFAASLAADPQHNLVVVDLPSGALETQWEPVARVLASLSGSVRLVLGRAAAGEVLQAGGRIADQVNKVVVAPDGMPRPVPGGGLFVPHDRGAGWLRFHPGRPSTYDSRRFPKPDWEYAVADPVMISGPEVVVEPIASGIWLRGVPVAGEAAERHWLINRLPSSVDEMTVVLGSPGGPPVGLPDVVRLRQSLLPTARGRLRFLQVGPVTLPAGAISLGQSLADAVGEQVTFSSGLPTRPWTSQESPDVEVPNRDGSAAWRPFTSEIVYFPGAGDIPEPPVLLGQRAPVADLPQTSTGVYAYTTDSVLEVVQSGLWLRPPNEPANGGLVRRLAAAPGRAAILYDRGDPAAAERMRLLAEDMLRQLDPALRDAFRVAPADSPGGALGWSDPDLWAQTAAPAAAPRRPARSAAPAATTPRRAAETGAADPGERSAAPAVGASQGRPADSGTPQYVTVHVTTPGAASPGHLPPIVSGTPAPASVPPRVARPAEHASGDGPPLTDPPLPDPGVRGRAAQRAGEAAAGDPVPGTPRQEPGASDPNKVPGAEVRTADIPNGPAADATTPPFIDPPLQTGVTAPPFIDPPLPPGATTPPFIDPPLQAGPTTPPFIDTPPQPGTGAPPPPPVRATEKRAGKPRIRLESDAAPAAVTTPAAAEEQERRAPAPPAGPPAPPPAGGVPPPVVTATVRVEPAVRTQPVPTGATSAVPPPRGLAEERGWVRRTFSAQYNALAGSVSRVMSQSPGLRGPSRTDAADALTDLVAVRLYLSDSHRIDAAVRSATVGPHIPLARCVAAGLSRLPSYRGPALLRAPLDPAELAWYHEGRLVTEWAFCTARTAPYAAAEDWANFLIWSMTARRTNLLDPDAPDRVVFVPGTSFKVLRCESEGTRPTVLLRELSQSEIAADGRVETRKVPLDEIALEGLSRTASAMETDPTEPPQHDDGPPAVPPGLLPAAIRAAAGTRNTMKGAKP